jgi:hypothetical protein
MGSEEFQILMRRLDHLETLLTGQRVNRDDELIARDPSPRPPTITPEMTEKERLAALHAEGHYILETQGFDAYKRFNHEHYGRNRKRSNGEKSAKIRRVS